jgi:hypothetical protein
MDETRKAIDALLNSLPNETAKMNFPEFRDISSGDRDSISRYIAENIDEAMKGRSFAQGILVFNLGRYNDDRRSVAKLGSKDVLGAVADICSNNEKYNVKLILDRDALRGKYYANIKEKSYKDTITDENITDNLDFFRSLLPHLDVGSERVDETARAMSLLVEDAQGNNPVLADVIINYSRFDLPRRSSASFAIDGGQAAEPVPYESAVVSPPETAPAKWYSHKDKMSVEEFLRAYWRPWLREDGLGVVTSEIRQLDAALGYELTKDAVRKFLPPDIKVPLLKERNETILHGIAEGRILPPIDDKKRRALEQAAARRDIALPHRGGPPVMLVRRFPRSGVHAATSSQ